MTGITCLCYAHVEVIHQGGGQAVGGSERLLLLGLLLLLSYHLSGLVLLHETREHLQCLSLRQCILNRRDVEEIFLQQDLKGFKCPKTIKIIFSLILIRDSGELLICL